MKENPEGGMEVTASSLHGLRGHIWSLIHSHPGLQPTVTWKHREQQPLRAQQEKCSAGPRSTNQNLSKHSRWTQGRGKGYGEGVVRF